MFVQVRVLGAVSQVRCGSLPHNPQEPQPPPEGWPSWAGSSVPARSHPVIPFVHVGVVSSSREQDCGRPCVGTRFGFPGK